MVFVTAGVTVGFHVSAVDDAELAAELSVVEPMMHRALKLKPLFGAGAIHDFLFSWYGGRPAAAGGSPKRALEHYEMARRAAAGKRVAVLVSYAEVICVKKQDKACFKKNSAVLVSEKRKLAVNNKDLVMQLYVAIGELCVALRHELDIDRTIQHASDFPSNFSLPAITAEAGLVPWAELGIRQMFRSASPWAW